MVLMLVRLKELDYQMLSRQDGENAAFTDEHNGIEWILKPYA